jgi:hypothetical protein
VLISLILKTNLINKYERKLRLYNYAVITPIEDSYIRCNKDNNNNNNNINNLKKYDTAKIKEFCKSGVAFARM